MANAADATKNIKGPDGHGYHGFDDVFGDAATHTSLRETKAGKPDDEPERRAFRDGRDIDGDLLERNDAHGTGLVLAVQRSDGCGAITQLGCDGPVSFVRNAGVPGAREAATSAFAAAGAPGFYAVAHVAAGGAGEKHVTGAELSTPSVFTKKEVTRRACLIVTTWSMNRNCSRPGSDWPARASLRPGNCNESGDHALIADRDVRAQDTTATRG